MSFPEGMPLKERRVLAAIAALLVVAVGVTAGLVTTLLVSGGGDEAGAQTIREHNIEVVPADIDYGGGNVWHAWTYKLAGEPAGTVPGPTLTAKVGERLVVHVKNNLDIVHSFHTHFTNYDIESDGSQANVISGKGAGAMIPPGGEGTYAQGGFDAVAAQLNKTVPAISAKTGEEMRVHVINIGDQVHSFHAHNVSHISEGVLQGRPWPANLLPLIPGAADTLRFTFTKPGLWLFHCHVVNHADNGEIEGQRVRRLVEDDEPALASYDQEALARERDYPGDDVRRVRTALRAFWGGLAYQLEGLTDEQWERGGSHPEIGRGTVRSLAARQVGHGARKSGV